MSSRQMRRARGDTNLSDTYSDEEFEPLYAKEASTSKSAYAGLEVSSNSENENSKDGVEEDSEPEVLVVANKEKKKKKKKKKKQLQKSNVDPESVSSNSAELDEIDKYVQEVNAILGTPPPPVEPYVPPPNQNKILLSVQAKWLNYKNEVIKLYGDVETEKGKKKRYRPHNVYKYRRATIVPTPENYNYLKTGFSMSEQRRENGLTYYVYNHNRDYQRMHQSYLLMSSPGDEVPLDEARRSVYVEALLECADFYFRHDEYSTAVGTIEDIIIYLQYAAHPCFNLTDQRIRLEYKYTENRPFFVTVLKYLYTLTNKAFHRTALELAKLLLNLDPSDPLGIIFVIDILALRAREHQWLVDIVDYWAERRYAKYLFNIEYSYAMAHFHLIKKSGSTDFTYADKLLQDAMMHFPGVVIQLLEEAQVNSSADNIRNHPIFTNKLLETNPRTPDKLKLAMKVHCKLVQWKWREHAVMAWFMRNANELVEKFNNDEDLQKTAKEAALMRSFTFAYCPVEIHRHLLIIRSLSKLLMDWEMPLLQSVRAWDPLPPSTSINRYSYGTSVDDPNYYTVIYNLFSSVMPNFIPEQLRGVNAFEFMRGNADNEDADNPGEEIEDRRLIAIRAHFACRMPAL